MPYRVELAPAAQRDLRRLPRDIQTRLAPAIMALAEQPRPARVRKLQGEERTWRIRIGAYRIIYDIIDNHALVVVLKVVRRSEMTYR
jgi:mRNA interferase RelE/StbE